MSSSVAYPARALQSFFRRTPSLPELVLAVGGALFVLHQQARLPALWPVLLIFLACLAVAARWRFFWIPAAFCLALAWGAWQAQNLSHDKLPAGMQDRSLLLEGSIVSLPEYKNELARFVFQPTRVLDAQGPVAFRALVEIYYRKAPMDLAYGQRWRLRVRLRSLAVPRNPGEYDRSFTLFWRGIQAVGRVEAQGEALPGVGGTALMRGVQGVRQRIIAASNAVLPRGEAGLVQALSIGVQKQIPDAWWQIFVHTGTAHLMVISGTHITLVAGWALLLSRLLWIATPLSRRYPAAQFGSLAMILTALLYGGLAGMDLPTLRAVIMICVLAAAQILQRESRLLNSLALAAGLIFLLQPGAVMEGSFWLSFTAVALIFWLLAAHRTERAWWRRLSSQHVFIALGMAPLLAVLFGQVPLLAPLANLVAVPLVEGLATPLALGASLAALGGFESVARWGFHAAALVLQSLLSILNRLDQFSWASLVIPQADMHIVLVMVLAVCVLLLPAAWPGRGFAALGVLPFLLPPPAEIPAGQARVQVLDAEPHMALLLRTRRHALLYQSDAYPHGAQGTDRYQVMPYLRIAGLTRLDGQVLNAAGSRVMPAAERFPRPFAPAVFWLNRRHPDGQAGIARTCQAGRSWIWDGVRFVFLDPAPGESGDCVLVAYGPDWQLLLGGNMTQGRAERLWRRFGYNLRSDLVVLHRGRFDSATLRNTFSARYLVGAGPVSAEAAQGMFLQEPGWATIRRGALSFHLGGRVGVVRLRDWAPAARYWRS